MNKKMIIGLTGSMGSGKDTVADKLIQLGGWERVSFANSLKMGLSAMMRIPMSDIEDPIIKNQPNYKFNKSIRTMMQLLGTEFGRNMIADDIWIQMARENIDRQLENTDNIIITDCRFDNEADMVHESGGYVIKIIRDNNPYTAHVLMNGVEGAHASESGVSFDKIDVVIYNSGTLDAFVSDALSVILKLQNKHLAE